MLFVYYLMLDKNVKLALAKLLVLLKFTETTPRLFKTHIGLPFHSRWSNFYLFLVPSCTGPNGEPLSTGPLEKPGDCYHFYQCGAGKLSFESHH